MSATSQEPRVAGPLEPNAAEEGGADGLEVRLETTIPELLPVGRGTSIFVYGSCIHATRAVVDVRLTLDGRPVNPLAQQMPRTDLYEMVVAGRNGSDPEAGDPDTRAANAYRSAFWGFLDFGPRETRGVAEVGVSVTLDGGQRRDAVLARVELEPGRIEPRRPGSGRQVAICMATFNPPPELFERQIESIRAQTHEDWVCVISDDASSPERVAEMQRILGEDPRFVLDRSPRRLGFYHNFERALTLAPASASFVAFADQDDYWHPDKIETLLGAIGSANLVYSDMRIVDGRGREISSTYWSARRNGYTNLASLMLANTITGAASLFRAELLEYALPFPPRHGDCYHDHWIALVALALGDLRYVDRPLYEYVQHGGAALGHAMANRDQGRGRDWARSIVANPLNLVVGWRDIYFWDYCRMLLIVRILRARCGPSASLRKRHALDLFLATQRSRLAVGWLALRRLRRHFGATETLDRELRLLHGLAWRKGIDLLTRGRRKPRPTLRNDARLPPSPADMSGPLRRFPELPWLDLAHVKTEPLRAEVRADVPERTNILIPEFDLKHLFGGYIAKLNLAAALARSGRRVRLVAVDRGDPLPADWRRRVESYKGLDGLFDRVEVAFPRDTGQPLEMNPRDGVLASTWWTAYAGKGLLDSLERERFVYLIQEYEPLTFPMGSMSALAEDSYRYPHFGVFSTELLREYFRNHAIGVYASGSEGGDRDSVAFRNAITPVEAPSTEELRRRHTKRMLFYARPEPHGARNMFEIGLMALFRAASEGTLSGWEVCGVGSIENRWQLELGAGVVLDLLPRRAQSDYGELLRSFDVGLALMYTPHPSLVPIEMASAGMRVVTNVFENKTEPALKQISTNMIAAEPSLDGVTAALREAVERAEDYEGRAAGSAVDWPTDWEESFDRDLVERISGFLEGS